MCIFLERVVHVHGPGPGVSYVYMTWTAYSRVRHPMHMHIERYSVAHSCIRIRSESSHAVSLCTRYNRYSCTHVRIAQFSIIKAACMLSLGLAFDILCSPFRIRFSFCDSFFIIVSSFFQTVWSKISWWMISQRLTISKSKSRSNSSIIYSRK